MIFDEREVVHKLKIHIYLAVWFCFCSATFTKVDIYYGELKSQTIDQETSYDIGSFWSNYHLMTNYVKSFCGCRMNRVTCCECG